MFNLNFAYNDVHFRQKEKNMSESKSKKQDMVESALTRLMDRNVKSGGVAYLCSLRLPRQFSSSVDQANDIFCKVQSDLCKYTMRQTGKTPKYVAVRTMDGEYPEYNCCLFTDADSTIDDIQDFMEKGKTIANGKTIQAGWDTSNMDIVEILQGAAQFRVNRTLPVSNESLAPMQEHLANIAQNDPSSTHQRAIFVSKTFNVE